MSIDKNRTFLEMKILKCTQNDVVVNFNDVIRIAHCALNIESIQPVSILTFKWTLYITKSEKYNVSLFCGFKDAGLERFRFKYYHNSIEHENRQVVWSWPYIMCCNY